MSQRIESITAKIRELKRKNPNMSEIALHIAIDSWLVNKKAAAAATLSEFREALVQAGE